MKKKKICWVTPDCFADCDIPYVPKLLDEFDIHWIIQLPIKSRYSKDDFTCLSEKYDNLTTEFIISKTRERYPFKMFEYYKVIKIIKREKPDIVYVNLVANSPWQIPMLLSLPKNKTIVTAHQGRVHVGMGHYKYNNFMRDVVYRRIKNVNMFSKSQAAYFKERYKDSTVYQIPLGLKYFGEPTIERPSAGENVIFLLFGLIVKNKNLPILLDAVNHLYERGIRDLKVVIRGMGYAVDEVKQHIKYPDIVDADFRYVDNAEIPNLFNGSHYLVQPYKEMSQSGPFKVAMQYNLPLITSDLEGFTDEMSIGNTGYTFKNEDINDLENVLIKCYKLAKNDKEYSNLLSRMEKYVTLNYSTENIVQAYIDMFHSII